MSTTVITPFINRLDKIKDRLPSYASRIIIENAQIIIEIIKENQLFKGYNSYGDIVGKYAWETESVYAKDPHNKPRQPKIKGQPYNFDWTGKMVETLMIKGDANKQEYSILSSIGKVKEIEGYFNTKLGDLTEENNEWVNENILLPNLYKKILEEMFIGLI